jgi:hypothetical protein
VILGDAGALILKICVKKLKTFIRDRAQLEKCSAKSSFSPVDFSQIGKFTSLG